MSSAHAQEKKAPVQHDPEAAPGPRMQQILQRNIAPWKRDEVTEEEAQLAELRRRPVRKLFGAEEAKRRLGTKPAKRRRTSPAARTKSATA